MTPQPPSHQEELDAVRGTLRADPNVLMAAIFGSLARGDDGEHSDVDVLVALAEDRPMCLQHLAARLEASLGYERGVDVLSLQRVRERGPSLLSTIMSEGLLMFDRDGIWMRLCEERDLIERKATEARAESHRRASRSHRRAHPRNL